MIIFPGSWGQKATHSLVDQGVGSLGSIGYSLFPNGEKRVQLRDSVEGEDVIFVQSMSPEPDKALVETLLVVDALRENGAKKVVVFITYLGYSLMNRHFEGESISVRAIARAMSSAAPDEVWLYDIHGSHTSGYFDVPVKLFDPIELYASYVRELNFKNFIIVAPDGGAENRARKLSELLGVDYVVAKKIRDSRTAKIQSIKIDKSKISKGVNVIIIDDLVVTGETISVIAKIIRESGVKEIRFMVTHFLGVKGSIERVLKLVDKLVTTNSVDHELINNDKVEILEIVL